MQITHNSLPAPRPRSQLLPKIGFLFFYDCAPFPLYLSKGKAAKKVLRRCGEGVKDATFETDRSPMPRAGTKIPPLQQSLSSSLRKWTQGNSRKRPREKERYRDLLSFPPFFSELFFSWSLLGEMSWRGRCPLLLSGKQIYVSTSVYVPWKGGKSEKRSPFRKGTLWSCVFTGAETDRVEKGGRGERKRSLPPPSFSFHVSHTIARKKKGEEKRKYKGNEESITTHT